MRERFVVAEQDVVGGAKPLDELRLEQQRLRFVVGRDDGHAARLRNHALKPFGEARDLRVIRHAVSEDACFADVQNVAARIGHAIDAGF